MIPWSTFCFAMDDNNSIMIWKKKRIPKTTTFYSKDSDVMIQVISIRAYIYIMLANGSII